MAAKQTDDQRQNKEDQAAAQREFERSIMEAGDQAMARVLERLRKAKEKKD